MNDTQTDALQRATQSHSVANYAAIFAGFAEKGIPEDQIEPRVNVFTYAAWQAQRRQVRKGEHGVKITTWVPVSKKDKDTGESKQAGLRPKVTTVFHLSQTDAIQ